MSEYMPLEDFKKQMQKKRLGWCDTMAEIAPKHRQTIVDTIHGMFQEHWLCDYLAVPDFIDVLKIEDGKFFQKYINDLRQVYKLERNYAAIFASRFEGMIRAVGEKGYEKFMEFFYEYAKGDEQTSRKIIESACNQIMRNSSKILENIGKIEEITEKRILEESRVVSHQSLVERGLIKNDEYNSYN